MVEELLNRLPDLTNVEAMVTNTFSASNPFSVVIYQELHRTLALHGIIRDSLTDLLLALRGKAALTFSLEELQTELEDFSVPRRWKTKSYPTGKALRSYIEDFLDRVKHLENWASDSGNIPRSFWLGALFNPAAIPTAVLQAASRKLAVPLDNVSLVAEVTKKTEGELASAPREGVHVHGLHLENARWDLQGGHLLPSLPRDRSFPLPVLHLKAAVEGAPGGPNSRPTTGNTSTTTAMYVCPVYYTSQRGQQQFVMELNLRCGGIRPPEEWIVAGVCALLNPE
jgi:dynein heavy chain